MLQVELVYCGPVGSLIHSPVKMSHSFVPTLTEKGSGIRAANEPNEYE